MPEKALEKDIFATPMLVRDVPEPVLKLLGDLSRMSSVIGPLLRRPKTLERKPLFFKPFIIRDNLSFQARLDP